MVNTQWGRKELDRTKVTEHTRMRTHTHTHTHACLREGANPVSAESWALR